MNLGTFGIVPLSTILYIIPLLSGICETLTFLTAEKKICGL